MGNQTKPVHPGKILREEYLAPHDISPSALATALGVPANRMTLLVREARTITVDTALRLARYFRTTPEFWMSLQASYDLRVAERQTGAEIRKAVRPMRVPKLR